MKKIARQIALLALLLLLTCAACRWATGNRYTAYVPIPTEAANAQTLQAVSDRPEQLQAGGAVRSGGLLRVQLSPRRRGEAVMRVVNEAGESVAGRSFRVGALMTVVDPGTGGFTGDGAALVAFTAFCFAVAFLMLRWFLKVKWTEFYGYGTIYAAGFSLFALLTGLLMACVTVRHLASPADFPMLSAYMAIGRASWHFLAVTSPLLAAFAAAMAVSNVALLRHEQPRLKNVLGILAAVILLAGDGAAWWLYRRGAEPVSRWFEAARGVYATVFVYFECMLAGAVLCGLRAAGHRPPPDRDYIVILGCRFRRDGTLTPLLQGRVDAAIAFRQAQLAATGKSAVLIPSGGQGGDESMPEAEAMRRYLVARGVPESAIRVEDRSRNTFQNMAFSREIIGGDTAKVAFATTNYHVFRSGVWASLAGLPAEGIGSPTRWWFWPNAFMRECLGLLRNRWKQELAGLAALIAFFAALSAVLV